MKWNLKQPGLFQQTRILIAIFVLFQILFVTLLLWALMDSQKKYEQESHIREVVIGEHNIIITALRFAGDIAMYQVTKDQRFKPDPAKTLNTIEKQKNETASLASHELIRFSNLEPTIDDAVSVMRDVQNIDMDDKSARFLTFVRVGKMAQRLNTVMDDIHTTYTQADEANRQALRTANSLLFFVISIGFATNILVTGLLVSYFERKTMGKFGILANNIRTLGLNKPLSDKLQGQDEMASLDQVIHQVSRTLADSRRKEQSMINNAVDVICSCDEKGKFTQVNQAVKKMWGLNADELIGSSYTTIIHNEDHKITQDTFDISKSTQSERSFENRIRKGDGTICDALWSIHWSNEEKNFFCVVHDITERKNVEKMKQRIVAMVSHDLRSPLTALELTLNVLKSGSSGTLDEKGVNRLERAERSVTQLIWLINDLIDVDKVEQGLFVLNQKETSDTEIVRESMTLIQGLADQAEVTVDTATTGITFRADANRLIRVVTNLLSNAIRYSPRQSNVELTCSADDEGIRFSVTDHGQGIPGEKLPYLFEPYYQVDSEGEKDKRGSGLGLTICKAIVEAHGGKIDVISTMGEGSTFWFVIPKEK